jgi:uncharacterized coiled-coil protein SlyX
VSRLTPRPVKASGARDAHGHILESAGGALYVHMHRERGLAHRHYVLRPWHVRLLSVVVSWPALVFYVIAVVTWGWMAGQAARVPALQQQVTHLTKDAERLDALTAQLEELRARYEQVQKMLSAAGAVRTAPPDSMIRPRPDSTRATRGVGGR